MHTPFTLHTSECSDGSSPGVTRSAFAPPLAGLPTPAPLALARVIPAAGFTVGRRTSILVNDNAGTPAKPFHFRLLTFLPLPTLVHPDYAMPLQYRRH